MITDASSTTRRRFLSAAGVGAVSAMRTPPSATADDGSRGYDLITVPPNTREEIVIAEDEVFENKLIDITAPGSDLIIKAHEPNYTIRNVGVRGEKSTLHRGISSTVLPVVSARTPGSRTVISEMGTRPTRRRTPRVYMSDAVGERSRSTESMSETGAVPASMPPIWGSPMPGSSTDHPTTERS